MNKYCIVQSDWLSIHPSFHLSIYPYFYPFNYPIWLWYSQIGASGQLASRGSECYEYLMVIQATNSLANVAKKRNKVTLSYLSLKGKSNKNYNIYNIMFCVPPIVFKQSIPFVAHELSGKNCPFLSIPWSGQFATCCRHLKWHRSCRLAHHCSLPLGSPSHQGVGETMRTMAAQICHRGPTFHSTNTSENTTNHWLWEEVA